MWLSLLYNHFPTYLELTNGISFISNKSLLFKFSYIMRNKLIEDFWKQLIFIFDSLSDVVS